MPRPLTRRCAPVVLPRAVRRPPLPVRRARRSPSPLPRRASAAAAATRPTLPRATRRRLPPPPQAPPLRPCVAEHGQLAHVGPPTSVGGGGEEEEEEREEEEEGRRRREEPARAESEFPSSCRSAYTASPRHCTDLPRPR
ncbi:uncharacterized protein [Miscanthus floridulus]|uniref:uncharacterized protein n=1 Tax=Miscanthus floridulus TaxID=154761 RepID=UPI003459F36A